jgi:gas vesicle protein
MSNRDSIDTSTLAAFLAGAVIAAGITLLLTPKTGSQVREKLGDVRDNALDKLKCCAKEAKFKMSPKTKDDTLKYDGGDAWI